MIPTTTKTEILDALKGVEKLAKKLASDDVLAENETLRGEVTRLNGEIDRLNSLVDEEKQAHKADAAPVSPGEEGIAEPEKVRPLTTYYVPIKENLGYRFVVWPTNLSIEKVSKDLENGRWDRLGSMSLTRRSVEFLATRAGSMLEQWDASIQAARA